MTKIENNKSRVDPPGNNTNNYRLNKKIASIVQCLSENPNGITNEELSKLKELYINSYNAEKFTDYFYGLVNKSKTVRDISALMKVVRPNVEQKSWIKSFEQLEDGEGEKNIGKNIIQAASSVLTNYDYDYRDESLVNFYRKLIEYRKDSNKEIYPEFYVKMLEQLRFYLKNLENKNDLSMDIMYYTNDINKFLQSEIPSNELFKEPYKNLLEAIRSIEESFIKKRYEENIQDMNSKFS